MKHGGIVSREHMLRESIVYVGLFLGLVEIVTGDYKSHVYLELTTIRVFNHMFHKTVQLTTHPRN